jgi:hypothetical protein
MNQGGFAMSIGPVDFRPVMSKVSDLARQQTEQQQRILGQEQQQAETSVKQAEQNTKSVHSQDEASKVTIKDKEERGGGRQRQNQDREDREEKKDKKEQSAKPQERHIDIRL